MSIGGNVLIVEDNWLIAWQVESWLLEDGVEVAGIASSIAEALKIADASTPALALVDFNLGGERAGPLIDELCARGCKVIVVTGYADLDLGASTPEAVLQKPCSKQQVIEALSAANVSAPSAPRSRRPSAR